MRLVSAQDSTTPAQTPSLSTPYGPSISLEAAKRVASAAQAEAAQNEWLMTVAVVDPSGNLIYYERADNSQWGSAKVSIAKARSAALYKRPTAAFQEAITKGGANIRTFALEGAVPVAGGVPLLSEGKIIGAIGVSGDLSENDAQCANAAARSLT